MERKIDRLDKYMKLNGLNDNKITVATGITNGVIGKSRQIGRDLSSKVIELILKCYTDINSAWLLTGEGEMLREKPSCQPTSTTSDENILINKLLDMITKQQETIERQQKSIEDLTALLSKQIVADKDTEAEAAKCAIAG